MSSTSPESYDLVRVASLCQPSRNERFLIAFLAFLGFPTRQRLSFYREFCELPACFQEVDRCQTRHPCLTVPFAHETPLSIPQGLGARVFYTVVRDNLGLVPTSRPKDHYIWLLASQTSLGTLYSSALLGCSLTGSLTSTGVEELKVYKDTLHVLR